MKKLIKILIIIFVVLLCCYIALHIKIKNIEIVGNTKYENEELISTIFKNEIDKISLYAFIKDLSGNKKKIKFINNYAIEWITPFTIKIKVEENKYVGFIKRDIKYVYFDQYGIINEISEIRQKNIPELRGINFKSYTKGDKLLSSNSSLVETVLYIFGKAKDDGYNLEVIDVDQESNITLTIGDIIVKLGTENNIQVKLKRLKDIYPEIKDLKGTLDLSDARENMIDEQYIFKKSS